MRNNFIEEYIKTKEIEKLCIHKRFDIVAAHNWLVKVWGKGVFMKEDVELKRFEIKIIEDPKINQVSKQIIIQSKKFFKDYESSENRLKGYI